MMITRNIVSGDGMPEVCRFLGIIITMYYNDHPPPHFHVRYNQQKAIIDIETLSILEGKLSPRVLGLVIEWAAMHKSELLNNWNLARQNNSLEKIEPLE
ncbi:MAG: DUF4160 domain-containing protein [Sphaerospermopsis sp.]|uniref:DUF4160 domain-containing protein n=1 Tax=Sphaerospermopsis sp. LEGE 00249 TaxID=1380707 RepID=UPI0021079566|nr:DUF4160 domain-containing protein [Sphaerospermopsis sp. LEGE 00249]MEB3149284.1 DUF4160 domain-containing protein [Sphaerospermopsis sp.]